MCVALNVTNSVMTIITRVTRLVTCLVKFSLTFCCRTTNEGIARRFGWSQERSALRSGLMSPAVVSRTAGTNRIATDRHISNTFLACLWATMASRQRLSCLATQIPAIARIGTAMSIPMARVDRESLAPPLPNSRNRTWNAALAMMQVISSITVILIPYRHHKIGNPK